jgi:hypothetical protein
VAKGKVVKKPSLKKAVFRFITLIPLLSILGVLLYFVFLTNVPQLMYLYSIRNIYFDCMEFSSDYYVYKMKPGQCKLKNLEYDTTLTHDNDGFRNLRPSSGFVIAAIGDSHTHGFAVNDDQTFSYLLESQFGFTTRNLGIGSYATMRELEVLDKYGKDAKYVILQYCDNDFGENLAEPDRYLQSGESAGLPETHPGPGRDDRKPFIYFKVILAKRG